MQNVPQDFLSEDWRAWILIHKFPLQLHCSQNVNSPALLCSFYPHRSPVTLEEKVLKHQRRMAGSVHKTVHHTWVEIKGRLRRCKTRNQAHLLQDDENWATITSFGAQHRVYPCGFLTLLPYLLNSILITLFSNYPI